MSEEIPTPVAPFLQSNVIIPEISLEDVSTSTTEPVAEAIVEPIVEAVVEAIVEAIVEPVIEAVVEAVVEAVAPIMFTQPTFQFNLFAAMNATR